MYENSSTAYVTTCLSHTMPLLSMGCLFLYNMLDETRRKRGGSRWRRHESISA